MTFRWIGKSEDGSSVTINKLNTTHFSFPKYLTSEWIENNNDLIRVGAAIDVETTGLNHNEDKVIEVGIRSFKFNRLNGDILSLEISYNGLEDPGFPLSSEIKALTGITDDMLVGQKIDWPTVDSILENCQIIISHNAKFDRPFIDRHSQRSLNKIWGCSVKHIDWNAYGFPSSKLVFLSIFHGFFCDAHRALNDSDALIYLLSLQNEKTSTPYLHDLLNNVRKSSFIVKATYAKYEKRELLKSRKYSWDAENRVWWKEIYQDLLQSEIDWLEELIYEGKFSGEVVEIKPLDRFKNIAA